MTPKAIGLAVNLIKGFEGFSSSKYVDGSKMAIGYGHNITNNDTDLKGINYITPKQAEVLLAKDLMPVSNFLSSKLNVPLSDDQYASLLSFGYNAGVKPLAGIVDHINNGRISEAARTIGKYVYGRSKSGNMVYMDGLANRRKKELSMFGNGVDESVLDKYFNVVKEQAVADNTRTVPQPVQEHKDKKLTQTDVSNEFIQKITPLFSSGLSYSIDINELLRGI